jgi:putative hemolysin
LFFNWKKINNFAVERGKNMSEVTNQKTDSSEYIKFIDIEKVVEEKSPRFAKILPGFVMRYLKKILHEVTLNNYLNSQKGVYGLDFVHASLKHFGVKLIVHGAEHLEGEDRVLVAANHPLGGLDGLALMASAGLRRPDFVFPVNDILLHLPNLRYLFVPVNKHGGHPKDAVRLLEEMMASDKTVLFFPAGLVSRKRKGVIADLPWKKTFISKARKHKRKIVPVYIDGQNSKFFYNLANLRKRLGMKTNIEMLYLVDEMYNQYDKEVNVFIGKPLSFEDLPKDKNDDELAEYIRSLVYTLPEMDIFSSENRQQIEFKTTVL